MEEMAKQVWFNRGTSFQNRVFKKKALYVRYVEVGSVDGFENLRFRIEVSNRRIQEEHEKRTVWMELLP